MAGRRSTDQMDMIEVPDFKVLLLQPVRLLKPSNLCIALCSVASRVQFTEMRIVSTFARCVISWRIPSLVWHQGGVCGCRKRGQVVACSPLREERGALHYTVTDTVLYNHCVVLCSSRRNCSRPLGVISIYCLN